MKIECVEGFDLGPEKFSPWLTVGKVYHVLSIERGADGECWFRIQTGQGDRGSSSVGLFRAENFRLVSSHRPSMWVDKENNGALQSSPESWQKVGFWEAFYDNDDETLANFEMERMAIVAEDP